MLSSLHHSKFRFMQKYLRWISARHIHSNHHINQLVDALDHEWLDRAQSFVRDPIHLPAEIDRKTIHMINKQTNGHDLLKKLIENQDQIHHCCVYNKAMQKCAMLKDWKSVQKIMDCLLTHQSIQPDLISFNIFINSMTLSDNPSLCIQYFQQMIKEYKIRPDVITFSSIIKALRRQTMLIEAERCWNLMIEKYKLRPHNILYCEMISIYSKANQIEKATNLFNDYLERMKNNELELDVVVFNAYLNVFSRCGDVKGMQSVILLFGEYGLELTLNATADIMRGCIKAREYKLCLQVIQQWTDNGKVPNMAMLSLKCIAFAQMIAESNAHFDAKYKLYQRMENVIFSELQFYGYEISPLIAKIQLDGAIFLYRSKPMEIVKIFESLLDRKLIGYMQCDKETGKMTIDLHLFSLTQSQFIIRYVFGFRLNELIENDDEEIKIIVGKGTHSKDSFASLRRFIMNELRSWNPPIRCVIDKQNEGRLIVNKNELLPYLNNKMHFQMTIT